MRNRFQTTLRLENQGRPPVWFMRQAGRYHSHYQGMKKRYSFIDLCKVPEAACETTMGPIDDFGFDAAILFSDLLFPLEALGMGLRYVPGPKLDFHVRTKSDLSRLSSEGVGLLPKLEFQAKALQKIRRALPEDKGLLGFVGGPLTLFYYAAVGSHQGGNLAEARKGLDDGRWEGFCDRLLDLLAHNMALQARNGVDTIAVMDTCAGDVEPDVYAHHVVPVLQDLFARYRALCPDVPITFYSKGTDSRWWDSLKDLPIAAIGVDWNTDVVQVLKRYGGRWAIQGNFDPSDLFLPLEKLEPKLRHWMERVKREVPLSLRQGWVCGLGHGVLQHTPEASVRLFLRLQKEIFGE